MYSTCLFCHGSLGGNEAIEHFQIGRRLAFDAVKGRLWVVCAHCSRWNLTPLEERWEAIDECERLFRARTLRAQTEQIGLAKLPEGLELVRIGRPLRPEFAAWRYGDLFGTRFRRRVAWIGVGAAAASGGVAAGVVTGVSQAALAMGPVVVAPLVWASIVLVNGIRGYRDHLRQTYVPRAGRRPYLVFGADIKETSLAPGRADGEWVLNFRYASGLESLSGDAARRVLGVLMVRVNSAGATRDTTRAASEQIASAGGPDAFMAKLARTSRERTGDYEQRRARFRRDPQYAESRDYRKAPQNQGALPFMRRDERLALEMAVHEEEERRALEDEMGPLEEAWKQAEAIAGIADDLLTPASTRDFIARHRTGGRR